MTFATLQIFLCLTQCHDHEWLVISVESIDKSVILYGEPRCKCGTTSRMMPMRAEVLGELSEMLDSELENVGK